MPACQQQLPRVAVIGGGSAGLVAAYALRGRCDVTLFERAPRLGGHVHAVTVAGREGPLAVETGFLAFHSSHYPELVALLAAFEVTTAPTGVGLGIWDEAAELRCDNTAWFSLFGDRLPAAGRGQFAELIARLFRHARQPAAGHIPNIRLDAFLASAGYDPSLARFILWPSISALWGFQPADILAMSALTVAESLNRFFITAHHEPFQRIAPSTDAWLTKLRGALDATVLPGREVLGLRPGSGDGEPAVWLRTAHERLGFDAAIVATHADGALALLEAPTSAQRRLLAAFPYLHSTSIVHTDASVLPADDAEWRDYNYRAWESGGTIHSLVTWHMNRLQGLQTPEPIFVTVSPPERLGGPAIAPAKILASVPYTHLASPPESVAARAALQALGVAGPIYFCGSYFGTTGSNECAIASALRAGHALLATL